MSIEREKILEEALILLNEVGLDKFTTRKLAERLGVQQPALYWHFRSKNDLLDAMNSRILARYHATRVPRRGEAWDQFTLTKARQFRKALLAVRDGARVNAGTRPGNDEFAEFEQQLTLYADAGFSPELALHASIAVARYVLGFVLEEQGERERIDEAGAHDPMDALAAFPLLSSGVKSLIVKGSINTDSAFETGLGYLVEGMRLSLTSSRHSRAPSSSPKRPRRVKG
jgi:TetR/AcrR family tetracycline transcriptional repressor